MPHPIKAEWLLILTCPPGGLPTPAGVLLLDRPANRISFKLKEDLNTGDEDIDMIWPLFAEELRLRAAAEGAEAVVHWLGTAFSHVFRVSDLRPLLTQTASQSLDALYEAHVEKRRMASNSS